MRKTFILQSIVILICFFGYFGVNAQSDYAVLTRGDTVYGKVQHLNYGLDQRIKLTALNNEKTTYTILEVKGFKMDDDLFHLVKKYDRYMYMKVGVAGYLSLYFYQMDNQLSWDGKFLHKKDGTGLDVPNLGFKRKLSEFLAEYDELSKEISSGKFTRNDLEEIVTHYNAWIDERTPLRIQTVKENDKVPEALIVGWSELESRVQASENLDDKKNILEMIAEAKSKTERGEKIPDFLVNVLRKSLAEKPELTELLRKALHEQ